MPNQHPSPQARGAVWKWFLFAFLLVIVDQVSKQWVEATFEYGERLQLLPVFDLTLVYNKGAAWSFLSEAGGWQRWVLTGISAVVSVLVVFWIRQTPRDQIKLLLALSFILGGAVGNLIDRALFGHVIDFLLVYYRGHHFPVFNIADSAITIGAFFLILDAFTGQKDQPPASQDA